VLQRDDRDTNILSANFRCTTVPVTIDNLALMSYT